MIEAVMYGMIPSANRAMRDRPPPLNVLSSPRMFPPLELVLDRLDGVDVDPRHRDVRADAVEREDRAVNASFLRISATVKALRIVDSICREASR